VSTDPYNDGDLDLAYRSISTVLDSLDALVYVTDMDTNEILFINRYGRKIWGDAKGKTCWKVLQSGQNAPCAFCTNHLLLDAKGKPKDVHVWEFQNTVNRHWYQCRDQAIRWMDGRLVRMEIATDITDRKFAEDELRAAKEQAEAQARTDMLTDLNNRRAFLENGALLLNQATRFNHPLSVIMLDVDHFKQINDTFGHAIGDSVLLSLAKILRSMAREVDVVGRIGGEEFAIILPETVISNAAAFAERLRTFIANSRLNSAKGEIRITASFGIASNANCDMSLDNLISKADEALYRAKQHGRNRIECDN
jgi:diguanylate cyclase (GGDEF)-like protein